MQTPAAFRQQRKGLREVILLKEGKTVKPPKAKLEQTLKIRAIQGREHGAGLPKPRHYTPFGF